MAAHDREEFARRLSEDFRWEQYKEHLERTYGRGTFFSKSWLRNQLVRKAQACMPVAQKTPVEVSGPASLPASLIDEPSHAVQDHPSSTGDTLELIRADIGDCTRCKLCEKRKNIVFGEGSPTAKLLFIGEGPGEQEDLSGRPFVGAAGQLLDKIIGAMGLKRGDVYIANVVKCRPPGNRTPQPDEAGTCEQFLFRQIDVINPSIMVALGGTALKCLLHDESARISAVRGKFLEFRGRKLMPTFHPAYLLRNPESKRDVWEDMKKVKAELGI